MLAYWPYYCISTGLILLVLLMLFDASCMSAGQLLLVALGLQSDHGVDLSEDMQVGKLGLRVYTIASLVLLIVAGVLAEGIGGIVSVRGTSLKRMLFLITLVCISSAVLSQWKSICWQGFQFRVACRSDEFRKACLQILQQWPHISEPASKIGLGILVFPEGKNTNLIGVDLLNYRYSSADQFGPFIYRNQGAILLDSMTYPEWKLEFHSEESGPRSFVTNTEGMTVTNSVAEVKRLDNHLYLVRYEEDYLQTP